MTTYYFISDLHIGGDGQLNECDFENELIAFLKQIAAGPQPAELIIVGDMFGLWETTQHEGAGKLAWIVETHPELFDQFRETGRGVQITVLPGNHDHELAVFPQCREILESCNIKLEASLYLTREVAGRTIWVEHGNQHDTFNRMPDFGNQFALPVGYFVTTAAAAAANRAEQTDREWLEDLESVYPNEEIPYWFLSNYFYKEMGHFLRWALLPFLLTFTVSTLILVGAWLERAGMISTRIFQVRLGNWLGVPGHLIDLVLYVNGVLALTAVLLAIPFALASRDIKKTLQRYGVDPSRDFRISKHERYLAAAQNIFESHPRVALFIYGHTHTPSLTAINQQLVINTGTWLKRLTRIRARSRLLPSVYVSSFTLSYFEVSATEAGIRVRYNEVPKKVQDRLTLAQRLQVWGKSPTGLGPIPKETFLPVER